MAHEEEAPHEDDHGEGIPCEQEPLPPPPQHAPYGHGSGAPLPAAGHHSTLHIPIAVCVEDFEGYINYRILDSIAYPGTYKKFMLARKDQEAAWAIHLSQQVQAVQTSVQELNIKEQELRASPLSALHIVWQHVAESNLPPSDLPLTIANCAISRKCSIPCVVVRGKGRGAQPFTVNSRFADFLFDVWIDRKSVV